MRYCWWMWVRLDWAETESVYPTLGDKHCVYCVKVDSGIARNVFILTWCIVHVYILNFVHEYCTSLSCMVCVILILSLEIHCMFGRIVANLFYVIAVHIIRNSTILYGGWLVPKITILGKWFCHKWEIHPLNCLFKPNLRVNFVPTTCRAAV